MDIPASGNDIAVTENKGVEAASVLAADSAAKSGPELNESPIDRAFEAAKKRIAADDKSADDNAATAKPDDKPAAPAAGGSTSTPGSETSQANAATGTSAGASPASTPIVAPANWDKTLAEQFNGLPDDTAKQVVLGLYGNLQAGFTRGMQALAEEKRALADVAKLRDVFVKDPRAGLQELAKQVGVEVWFERPLPEGDIPEFATPQEMAKWVANESQRNLRRETQAEFQKLQLAHQTEAAKSDFIRSLEQAANKFPDFVQHRDGILAALQRIDGIDAEGAYRLAAFDAVQAAARELPQAKEKIAALEHELKTVKTGQTRPGNGGAGKPVIKDPSLSPVERAMNRAQQRIAAQGGN